MDIVTMIHMIVAILALIAIIVIFMRLSRTGYFEEEQRSVIYELKSQQISSQLVILARYVRKLVASWEYLLLLITLITMASILSHPAENGEVLSATLVPININLTSSEHILYSSSGLNIANDLRGSVVAEIYLGALGEPIVIEADQRIFRAFSLIIVNCSSEAGSLDRGSGLGSLLESICGIGDSPDIYLVMSRLRGNVSYGEATLYYGEGGSRVQLRIYDEGILKPLRSLPCVENTISSFIKSMEYGGGVIAPRRFTELFGLGGPNIAIIVNTTPIDRAAVFKDTGAEIMCSGAQEPGKAFMYTLHHRSLAREVLDIAIVGVAGGVILIIFNRSVIPRIMPGSEAILISGGTYWISRILPLVSIAVAELISVLALMLSYPLFLSLKAGGEPFISPPGLLPVSLISLTISFAHMLRVKTSYSKISAIYVEKAIPARGYSYVVEDLSHRDIARSVTESLEGSEFFSVLEKEIMEREDLINVRLRLLYRYSIGVGADVNIYISKHNKGSFIDIDIEPWSVDAGRGGILDSVAKMILSRISGAIVVARISRGVGES